jgi:hypothetical protein
MRRGAAPFMEAWRVGWRLARRVSAGVARGREGGASAAAC